LASSHVHNTRRMLSFL